MRSTTRVDSTPCRPNECCGAGARPARTRAAWVALCAFLLFTACVDVVEPPPPDVASVQVTSPIGNILPLGTMASFSAQAFNQHGGTVTAATFSWRSSNPDVASVNASGVVTALGTGAVTITATEESSGIEGSLDAEILQADIDAMLDLLNDPFIAAFVNHLSSAIRSEIQGYLDECLLRAQQGNLERTLAMLADAMTVKDRAQDQTDVVLLYSIDLMLAHAMQRLGQ